MSWSRIITAADQIAEVPLSPIAAKKITNRAEALLRAAKLPANG